MGQWRVGELHPSRIFADDAVFVAATTDGKRDADKATDRNRSDAAFIVTACNSHDALLARVERLEGALVAIVNPATTEDSLECCSCSKCMDAIDNARAALAAGDGEGGTR